MRFVFCSFVDVFSELPLYVHDVNSIEPQIRMTANIQ